MTGDDGSSVYTAIVKFFNFRNEIVKVKVAYSRVSHDFPDFIVHPGTNEVFFYQVLEGHAFWLPRPDPDSDTDILGLFEQHEPPPIPQDPDEVGPWLKRRKFTHGTAIAGA